MLQRNLLALLALLATVPWIVLASSAGMRGSGRALPSETTGEVSRPEGATQLTAPEEAEMGGTGRAAQGGHRSRGAFEIAGKVVLPAGWPAEELVRVEAVLELDPPRSSVTRASARAEPDGSFVLGLPADAILARLEVDSDFLFLTEKTEARPGARDVVLQPEVRGVIEGRLVVPAGEEPPEEGFWEDVEIWWAAPSARRIEWVIGEDGTLEERSFWDGNRSLQLVQPEGTFVMHCVPVGVPLQLVACAPHPFLERDVAPLAPGERRTVALQLEPGWRQHAANEFEVRGFVVDERGWPVVAELTAVPVDRRAARAGTTCAPDGSFRLTGLDAGSWKIHAVADGWHPAERALRVGQDTPPLWLVLASPGEVRGRVLGPDGQPVAAAEVAGSSLSDELGRFTLRSVDASVELWAWKEGFAPSTLVEVELAQGQRIDDVVVHLREACALSGRVIGWSRRDSPPEIAIEDANGEVFTIEADEWGAFLLVDLPPGELELFCSDGEGGGWHARTVLAPGPTREVELYRTR